MSHKSKLLVSLNSLQTVRLSALGACAIMALFMLLDLALLPVSLKPAYLLNRLLLQLPIIVLFFAISYSPLFERFRNWVILPLALALVYANIGLMVYCWVHEGYVLPYEGTPLYVLFIFVVLRPPFMFSATLAISVAVGVAITLFHYPIYGDRNLIHFCFIVAMLGVGLAGVYLFEKVFKQLIEANKKLREASRIDPLTRLFNRRSLVSEFATTLEHCKRFGQKISVLMVDLDHFKDYNDSYGHRAGDVVLQMQADILRRVFKRTGDVVGRISGEQFMVISVGQSRAETLAHAESLLHGWRRERCAHGKGAGDALVSCSIGIFHGVPNIFDDMDSLEKYADSALKQAKQSGRACYSVYHQQT